eukprot:98057_1
MASKQDKKRSFKTFESNQNDIQHSAKKKPRRNAVAPKKHKKKKKRSKILKNHRKYKIIRKMGNVAALLAYNPSRFIQVDLKFHPLFGMNEYLTPKQLLEVLQSIDDMSDEDIRTQQINQILLSFSTSHQPANDASDNDVEMDAADAESDDAEI